ncbi:methyl-accepting chemotaxis protein [Bacillus salitolerans]|uniref:Methyl-accepting chemotaxis protein n=1 Tax=Bacillus salitolerans TaxID=1437434 RepID=A0ABW4LUV6_9BACI
MLQNIGHQKSSSEEVAFAVSELATGISTVASSSTHVFESSNVMESLSNEGNQSVQNVSRQMELIHEAVLESAEVVIQLGERSKEIGNIIQVITDISTQTNLLALNAAIEAARAGEHGKGFAIVADEVRKLAEQTEKSATQISSLINEIQVETTNAVLSMDKGKEEVQTGMNIVHETGEKFLSILQATNQVTLQIHEVTDASSQMSKSSDKVSLIIEKLAEIASKTTKGAEAISRNAEDQQASMEQIVHSTENLNRMAFELDEIINKFKI